MSVEFLLVCPVALLFFLAVAEFGLFLTNLRHAEAAAFAGAHEAAKLEIHELDAAADVAKRRVDRTLNTAGLCPSQVVTIEHNVPGGSRPRQSSGQTDCDFKHVPSRPLPRTRHVSAVRCTVVVSMDHLAPDLLAFAGWSISEKCVRSEVTVPYIGHDHGHHHGHHRHHHHGHGHGKHKGHHKGKAKGKAKGHDKHDDHDHGQGKQDD